MGTTLAQKLRALKSTTPELAKQLEALFVPVNFNKNSTLNTSDHFFPILYFIEAGMARKYFIYRGQEYTSGLVENGFLLPLAGFFSQKPTQENVTFLENSTAWSLNLSKAEVLAQREPYMYRVLLEIYEEALHTGKQMELMLRLKTADERFAFMQKTDYNIVFRVFNHIAASFLDVTEKYLSFIKGKSNNK